MIIVQTHNACWTHNVLNEFLLVPCTQVFRTDLITAMKLHDSYQLNTEDYYVLSDPWRQEWEKGVQVPVSPHSIPKPTVRYANHIMRCELWFSKNEKEYFLHFPK